MTFDKLKQQLPENQVLLLLRRTAPVRDKNTDAIITPGRVLPSEENIRTILMYDSRIADSIAYNVFADRLLYEGQEISDEILTELRFWLADEYNMRNKYGNLVDAGTLETVLHWYGRQKKIDPLADYLNGLEWDGEKRLHFLFSRYFGANNTELVEQIGIKWAVSCVARGLVGGAKVDTVLVLVGKQGVKKSSALRTLAGPDLFSDSHLDIRSKEAYQLIHSSGVWIWELAELQAIKTRDAENVKMFLSSQRDRYRPSYGRLPVTKDRRVIFTATTNEVSFLSDDENRRFWPIQVGSHINIDQLKIDRDQLWAEAVALYKNGSNWWLDDKYNDDLKEYQSSFHIEDPWELACKKGLEDPQDEGVTIEEILNILELPQHQRHKGTVMRLAKILQRMGCSKKQTRIPRNGVTGRYYVWNKDKTL
tara:strand:+ start:449 stop:1714 length:1266 start_codon:yes stop_codon:yes gene_type:complete